MLFFFKMMKRMMKDNASQIYDTDQWRIIYTFKIGVSIY